MPRELSLTFPPAAEPPRLDDGRALLVRAAKKLRRPPASFAACRPLRLSFDARPRHRVWRLQVALWEADEPVPAPPASTPPHLAPPPADAPHVVVVGSGPAGLFCALDLLAGGLRVSVLERGAGVRGRRRALRRLNRGEGVDPDTNYCFGEGGAGTFSDGKLYTRTGRKDEVRAVLETLVAHGAPPEILVHWRPHVGSNRLPSVVEALCASIRAGGGAVRFGARVERIETLERPGGPRVAAVHVRDVEAGGARPPERIAADAVVLATGHSALDAVTMACAAGARAVPKGFAMGVRVEHAQEWLDRRQYGGLRADCELPAAFYELAAQAEGRGVYSFCMCPGGFVVPATTSAERVVVNGMSLSRRDSPYANSGLVVAIEPEDWCGERGARWGWDALLARAAAAGADLGPGAGGGLPARPEEAPLFGLRVQRALEAVAAEAGRGGGRAPSERMDRWIEGGIEGGRSAGDAAPLPTSYRPGLRAVSLADVLPPGLDARLRAASAEFDRKLPGFVSRHGQALGVESRTSSPVRLVRDEVTCAALGVAGLYPAGEGAGYAGGIVSAALDGRRVAAALLAGVERARRQPPARA